MANQIKSDRQLFAEKELAHYSELSKLEKEQERQYEKLSNRISKLKEYDPLRKELEKQTAEASKRIAGFAKQREESAKRLEKLGFSEQLTYEKLRLSSQNAKDEVKYTQEVFDNIQKELDSLEKEKKNARNKRQEKLEKQIQEKTEELEYTKSKLESDKRQAEFEEEQNSTDKVTTADILRQAASINVPGASLMTGISNAMDDERHSAAGKAMDDLADAAKGIPIIGGAVSKVVDVAGRIFDVVNEVRKSINNWVDDAAKTLSNYVGKINAALEGTGQTYATTTESMVKALGMSRFVKQTDYLAQIANLTAKGITYNVEQRALLETIKDKTIASFDAANTNLRRLIRIRQQDITANMFGVEAALRNTLNNIFKDSSYLYGMYDQVYGAITDALVVSGKNDFAGYNSVVQTWMGAMYESGVDGGLVNKLANAINNLGSGNVSALSSDADIQRLILLSMDTIGMDYADVLQQGLSTSDITDLLTAVVKYLSRIETNTKDNNVLTSSYTNLFGMTRADLAAIKNLEQTMGSLTAVNGATALEMTKHELDVLQSTDRTIIAEQVDNAFANAKFTFGNQIAKDSGSYISWKLGNFIMDIADAAAESHAKAVENGQLDLVGGAFSKAMGVAAGVAGIPVTIDMFKGLYGIFKALPSLFKGEQRGLATLVNGSPSYGDTYVSNGLATSGGDYTSMSAAYTNNTGFKTVNSPTILESADYTSGVSEISAASAEWQGKEEKSEEEKILALLEEFDGALVESEAGAKHKAFATYLVGMTDETLRSFASIFADEDAMADTFTGKNNTLKDNLFKYLDDTTSNSKKKSNEKSKNK